MMRRLGPTRLLGLALIITIAFVLWWEHATPDVKSTSITTFDSQAGSDHIIPRSDEALDFWDRVGDFLHTADPNFGEIKQSGPDAAWQVYNAEETNWHHIDSLEVTQDQFRKLKSTHEGAIKDAKILGPKLPLERGTRGIVTSCANDAIPVAITSLRMLRTTGSKLPVQIFLDFYEPVPCDIIFPSLGATCNFVEDYMPKDMKHPIHAYHFMNKALAIVLSKFEQVLYLDSDLFPVMNPDSIFTTEPFISENFVTWPDFWALTASHIYYELAGRPQTPKTKHASTESGALLINKATHSRALLLALMYNNWGDKYWYRLFSQGAQGQGDKETWQMAIETLDMSSYRVTEPIGRIGYECDGHTQFVASQQHHPHDDWINTKHGVPRRAKGECCVSTGIHPRVLFIHGNLPKLDGPGLLGWKLESINWLDILRCGNGTGKPHRLWGPKELTILRYGWDAEKAVWDSMRWSSCEHEFDFWVWVNGTWHSEPKKNVCSDMEAAYPVIMEGETYTPDITTVHAKEPPWGATVDWA